MLIVLIGVICACLWLALSWAITVGFIFLIAWCFKIQITLLTATGIWLVLWLLKMAFPSNNKNK